MKYRKITAIIPVSELDDLEQQLGLIGVPAMTVSPVRGLGEYRNFFSKDGMSECTRVEIFCLASKAAEIKESIIKSVGKGLKTDGMIAILPVEELIHINDYNEVTK